jgi:hypothetical protein
LPVLLRCLPAHCLFGLLALAHFTVRGRGLTFLKAKGAALLKLPLIWRKRRAVQSRRLVPADFLLQQMERHWLGIKFRGARRQRRWERRPTQLD